MQKFVMQWHITHKCNLRCKHCYQEDYKSNLSYKELKYIFYNFLNFIKENNFKGHINFTGGEPLLSKDLFKLLDLCEKENITFGILTNGTLITKEIVRKLKEYNKLSFIQVSVDGKRETHNIIRGKNNYEKTFSALKLLRKNKIETMVSFTCHKENYKDIELVIKECIKNKVDRFWADRLVPIGSNIEQTISTEEYQEVISILKKYNKKRIFRKTKIHANRSLQWLCGSEEYYKCSAGKNLIAVLGDGTILPCRRLPIEIGNMINNDLTKIYKSNKVLKELQKDKIPEECSSCLNKERCKGGAKCINYALYKDYNKKDYNCPI